MDALKTGAQLEDLRRSILDRRDPRRPCITICAGTGCHACGCEAVTKAFREEIARADLGEKVDIRTTGCHGFCERGPIVVIRPDMTFYQRVTPADVGEIISETIEKGQLIERLLYEDPATGEKIVREHDIPFYKHQDRIIFANNGQLDPTSIADYIALNGYSALCKTLTEQSPEEIIEAVKRSRLRGRGGAGFPTGVKWEVCRNSLGDEKFPTGVKWEVCRNSLGDEKFVVCNCDEGDPGAYMDRSLLEGNPHLVIEGMTIGAYAIGASEGFVYVRNEYPFALENLSIALGQAKEYGFLGRNIFNSGFNFSIKINRGGGAFVCGEESSLIASLEGVVGEPRQRPPFPAEKGLWGRPTNINNVETWANIPFILDRGADWFASIGTEGSKGTKIFSLVGKINNTGLVEVPMGITVRDIVFNIGGGIPSGKRFKAVQTGGPSGGCIPLEHIDLPVDFDELAKVGSMMGSGGMIVMDEDTCMVDVARYFLDFLKEESCGKCVPCREGIDRLLEVLTDICAGRGKEGDLYLLEELASCIKGFSLCALGGTAPNPVLSTIKYFRDEYEAHIRKKQCPAVVCNKIVSSPCQYTCPLGTDVPSYVALVTKGEFASAAELVRRTNPLPNVCARVCHRPCEGACRAGDGGEPIAIRALKRVAFDYERRHPGAAAPARVAPQYERVAVVGSGPAGLTAARHLARAGYEVTIFEAEPVAGGMLALCIPEYRLPREVLELDIGNIESTGVEIRTNTALGRDVTLDQLFEQGYKAVFIATGAYRNLNLGIPGEDADGVIDVIELLKAAKRGETKAPGRRVGIIGGGNAAIDAARTAHRLGCEEVTVIYRRTRTEMPADESEIDEALHEGIKIHYLAAPTRVLTQDGQVCGVECIRMELGDLDASGRRRPVPVAGSEFTVELDALIPAIGQQPDLSFLPEGDGFTITRWNTIQVDEETYATGRAGVFAAGDVVTGPATVTEAMKAGKIAAESIRQYLRGQPIKRAYKVTRPEVYVPPMELAEGEEVSSARPKMPALPVEERCAFAEVELGFSDEQACQEGKRCLRCDLSERQVVEQQEDGEEMLRVSSAG